MSLLMAATPIRTAKPTANPVAVSVTATTPASDKPCTGIPARDRSSALCAQWVSADAAKDAAFWALLSAIFTAASVIGLVVTLLLTIRSNTLARQTAERELRAYVSVKVVGLNITQYEDERYSLSFMTKSHNGGSTPAYNCVHFATYRVMTRQAAAIELATVKSIEENDLSGGTVIHSGEDYLADMGKGPAITRKEIEQIRTGRKSVVIFGVCSYVDTFKIRRRTDFCQLIDGENFSEAFDAAKTSPEEAVEVKWMIAPYHNTAT